MYSLKKKKKKKNFHGLCLHTQKSVGTIEEVKRERTRFYALPIPQLPPGHSFNKIVHAVATRSELRNCVKVEVAVLGSWP